MNLLCARQHSEYTVEVIPLTTLYGRYYYYPHSTDGETDELCAQVTQLLSGQCAPESVFTRRALHCFSQGAGLRGREEAETHRPSLEQVEGDARPSGGTACPGDRMTCVCLAMRATSAGRGQ